MPDVTPYKRGQWLKADDVKTGDLIIFKDGGFEVDGFGGKPALEFTIELADGSEIKMTPNRPSISALAEAWGDNSDEWVGKQAIIEIKTEIIQGEDKNFIVLTPNDDASVVPTPPSDVPPIQDKDIPVVE